MCGWVGQAGKWSSLSKAKANASVDRAILIEGRYSQTEVDLVKTSFDVLRGPDGIEGVATCYNYAPEVINSGVLFFHFIKEDTFYGYELDELILDQNAWDRTKHNIERKVEGFVGKYIKEFSV